MFLENINTLKFQNSQNSQSNDQENTNEENCESFSSKSINKVPSFVTLLNGSNNTKSERSSFCEYKKWDKNHFRNNIMKQQSTIKARLSSRNNSAK